MLVLDRRFARLAETSRPPETWASTVEMVPIGFWACRAVASARIAGISSLHFMRSSVAKDGECTWKSNRKSLTQRAPRFAQRKANAAISPLRAAKARRFGRDDNFLYC